MTKLTRGRTSEMSYDGAMPAVVNSGRLAFGTAAVANQGFYVANTPMRIVRAGVRILATTASTAADLQIGTATGTSNRILQPIDLLGAGGVRYYDITHATLWGASGKNVAQGEVIKFGLAAATAAGSIAVTLELMPQSAAGNANDDLG